MTKIRTSIPNSLSMPESKAKTGRLVGEVRLTVGAKAVNVDVSDGLVNGARGTVK